MLPINPNGRIIIIIISCSWLFLHWYDLILESYRIFVTGLFQPRVPYLMSSWIPTRLAFPNALPGSLLPLISVSQLAFRLQSVSSWSFSLLPMFLIYCSPKWALWLIQPLNKTPTFLFPLPITVCFPSSFHIVWDLWSLATHLSLLSLQPLPCVSYKGCWQTYTASHRSHSSQK